MPKSLQEIMKEMFDIVGEKFSVKYVQDDNWFNNHSWTDSQRNTFTKWLIGHLSKNKKIQKELLGTVLQGNALARWCGWFTFNFGWSLKDDSNGKNKK